MSCRRKNVCFSRLPFDFFYFYAEDGFLSQTHWLLEQSQGDFISSRTNRGGNWMVSENFAGYFFGGFCEKDRKEVSFCRLRPFRRIFKSRAKRTGGDGGECKKQLNFASSKEELFEWVMVFISHFRDDNFSHLLFKTQLYFGTNELCQSLNK